MKEIIDNMAEKSVENTRNRLSAENTAKQEVQMGNMADAIRSSDVTFGSSLDKAVETQSISKELDSKINDVSKKIEEDNNRIAEAAKTSKGSYDPVISGAEHRNSLHESELNGYKYEKNRL